MLCEDEKELRCRLEWKRVVARNTKFTAICNKFTPLQLFWGPQLKKLHFVLAKCLKWRRNHDPYGTKTNSNFICSKWKHGKNGNFQWWKRTWWRRSTLRASYRRRHHVFGIPENLWKSTELGDSQGTWNLLPIAAHQRKDPIFLGALGRCESRRWPRETNSMVISGT